MAMTVTCECGREVDVDFTSENIKLQKKLTNGLIGEQKCPNPDCDKKIFVNATFATRCINADAFINSKVDWYEVKSGTVVYVDKCPYTIALKSIRKIRTPDNVEMSMHLLYLRSRNGYYNVVGEVLKSGAIALVCGREEPFTPSGYESWTEEKLREMTT